MIKRATTCIILCLVLTGCFVQQNTTIIKEDTSGVNEISFGFSREFMSFVGMAGGGTNDLEDVLSGLNGISDQLPAEWNATTSPWESTDGRYTGSSVRMEFTDLDMLAEQLAYTYTTEGNTLIVFEDVVITNDGGVLHIQARVTSPDMSELAGTDTSELESMGMFGIDMPVAVWQIELPDGITNWSEREIAIQENNTIKYTFPFPMERDYDIVVEGPNGILSVNTLLASVMAGLGVILCVMGVILLARQRRRPVQATAWAAPQPPAPSYPSSSNTQPLADPWANQSAPATASQPLTSAPKRDTQATQTLGSYQPPLEPTEGSEQDSPLRYE